MLGGLGFLRGAATALTVLGAEQQLLWHGTCGQGRPGIGRWASQPPTRGMPPLFVDRDGDGHIEAKELATVMRIMGMAPSDQQLQELITSVDVDGNGKVSHRPRAVLFFPLPAHSLPLVPRRWARAFSPRVAAAWSAAPWCAARLSSGRLSWRSFPT